MSGISVVCRNWNLCFLEKKFKRTIDIIVFARILSFKLHFFWWQIFWHTVQNWDAFFIFFILAGRKPLFMNYLSCSLSLYPQTQHQFHINLDKSLHTIFGNFSNFHCALKNLSRMYLCTLMHCYKQLKKA